MSGQVKCTECGGQVVLGYPTCPHCKQSMPATVAPLKKIARKRSDTRGGTTTAETPDNRGNFTPWIIGALCLGGLFLFWASRSSKEEPQSKRSTAQAQIAAVPTTAVSPQPIVPVQSETSTPPPAEEKKADARRAVANTLTDQLADKRLWSTVNLDDSDTTKLTIQSSSCEDESIKVVIKEAAKSLKEAGLTNIHCIAKHGGLIFDLPL